MTIDTKNLRKLAEAATPGPWVACGPSFGDALPRYLNEVAVDLNGDDDGMTVAEAVPGMEEESSADMAFIAAANPAVVLELLDRLDAAQAELDGACDEEWLTGCPQCGIQPGAGGCECDEEVRLHDAAPDLLAALRGLLREHDAITIAHSGKPGITDRWPDRAAAARAAIRKATGEKA